MNELILAQPSHVGCVPTFSLIDSVTGLVHTSDNVYMGTVDSNKMILFTSNNLYYNVNLKVRAELPVGVIVDTEPIVFGTLCNDPVIDNSVIKDINLYIPETITGNAENVLKDYTTPMSMELPCPITVELWDATSSSVITSDPSSRPFIDNINW